MNGNEARPKLSVVMPAFNEGREIEHSVAELVKALDRSGYSYEILVVDDGSIDLTAEIARDLGADVFRHERTLGKGAALRTGFQWARGEIVVTLDADLSHDPAEIPALIEPLLETDADLVIGTRFSRGANIKPYAINWVQRLANVLLSGLVSLLTGISISDSLSSFRAYRREALEELKFHSQGAEAEAEIILKTANSGRDICEVPVTFRARPAKEVASAGLSVLKTIITFLVRGR